MFDTPRTGGINNYATVVSPDEAQEPVLATPVKAALLEWLTEIWAEKELKAVGLEPRKRAMFFGPPGTGKTTLAHHLAARLGLPLAIIHPERVIDAWVGSSARNVGGIFDALEKKGAEPHVLFFDEFEALGGKRRQIRQGADAQRNEQVTTLLQRIERYHGYVIAATNRPKDIDEAIWRRFEIQIEIALPEQAERRHILARYLSPYGLPDDGLDELALAFGSASPALIRQFCEGLKRQFVIGPKVGWVMEKEVVMARLIAAVAPHPDLGKPRLWSHGVSDLAIRNMPWPLPTAEEASAMTPTPAIAGASSVVSIKRGPKP